jgi:hypothetical protein
VEEAPKPPATATSTPLTLVTRAPPKIPRASCHHHGAIAESPPLTCLTASRHRAPDATATLRAAPTIRFHLLVQHRCAQGHRATTVKQPLPHARAQARGPEPPTATFFTPPHRPMRPPSIPFLPIMQHRLSLTMPDAPSTPTQHAHDCLPHVMPALLLVLPSSFSFLVSF